MGVFSTREIAIGLYVLLFIIYIIANKKTHSAAVKFIKSACTKKLVIPFLLMIVYACLFVYVLTFFKFWNWIYIKDITIWVLFAGIPMCFNAVSKHIDKHYFRNMVKDNLKFTALIEFFTGTFTFNIIVEFILQPVIVFTVLLHTMASLKNKHKKVEKFMSGVISLIGIIVLAFTFKTAIDSIGSVEGIDIIVGFCLPISLSILYVPVAYFLAVYSKYELLFIRMSSKCPNDKKLIRKRQTEIFLICGLSYEKICRFEKECIKRMYVTMKNDEFDSMIYELKTLFKSERWSLMKIRILKKVKKIRKFISKLPNVKSCELATNTFDEMSDTEIEIDVSGYDNGKFMLELPDKLKEINVIYCDYSSDLVPDTYTVSIAVDEHNPFFIINLKCKAEPHFKTILKDNVKNNKYTHILKLWVDNLKRYYCEQECSENIRKLAQEINIKNADKKEPIELLEKILIWLENNQTQKYQTYVNSCRRKFDELIPKKNKSTLIDYLNKNSNAVTIMLAVLTPVFGAFLTFMLYCYYHGYYVCFSLSEVWLDLSSSNNIFYPIFMVFVSLLLLIFNAIPIILTKYVKFGKIISLFIGVLFYVVLFGLIKSTAPNKTEIIIGQALIIWVVIYGIGLIDGIVNVCYDLVVKPGEVRIKNQGLMNSIAVVIIIASLIIEVFLCYFTGYSVAQNQTEFKIIEYNGEKSVVLYESSDKFVLARATIIENDDDTKYLTIHTSEQIIIDNTELNYNIIQFNTKPNIE